MNNLSKLETNVVIDNLQKLMQIRYKILELFKNTEDAQKLSDLPPSMIPSDLLYDISVCYEGMYDTLFKAQLIKAGHITTSKQVH
jgi:hypothetical protein